MARSIKKINQDESIHGSQRREALLAKAATQSKVLAANTICHFNRAFGELELMDVVDELALQNDQLQNGDMNGAVETLAAQAAVLDTLFNSLAVRALQAPGLDLQSTVLKLAMQAQRQYCQTCEVLTRIKNPAAVTVVRQTNIGRAEQVNNGNTEQSSPANLENELLEKNHGEWLDIGKKIPSVTDNSNLETLEKSTGPKTEFGKARSSRIADKGLEWPALLKIRGQLKKTSSVPSKL